jgi:hypothetical protein
MRQSRLRCRERESRSGRSRRAHPRQRAAVTWRRDNVHIPHDLPPAMNEAANAEGKSIDDLAADAVRRYLGRRKLEELCQYGREQSRRLGYTEADVLRLIAESRRENRGD